MNQKLYVVMFQNNHYDTFALEENALKCRDRLRAQWGDDSAEAFEMAPGKKL